MSDSPARRFRSTTIREGLVRATTRSDGRFSGATRGLCIGYAGSEAAVGGPTAALRDQT